MMPLPKLGYQPLDGLWRAIDVAEKAHLPVTADCRHGY
jgi:hypothetical protein